MVNTAKKILDRILLNEGITETQYYDGHLQFIYDELNAYAKEQTIKENDFLKLFNCESDYFQNDLLIHITKSELKKVYNEMLLATRSRYELSRRNEKTL